jgi:hypothetical protein
VRSKTLTHYELRTTHLKDLNLGTALKQQPSKYSVSN